MANAPEGEGGAAPSAKAPAGKRGRPPKAAPAKAPQASAPKPRAPRALDAEDPVLAVQNRVSRAAMARSQSMRPPAGGRAGETRGRLYIDPALVPPGMEAQWIRETVNGERDDGNIEIALSERGFVAATTDDFPSIKTAELPDRRSNSNLIRRGGMILMLRPKQEGEHERAVRAASDAATLRAVNKELAQQADGKVIQGLPGAAVQTAVDSTLMPASREVSLDRFADA
jgi:hypothetical protein